MYKIFIDEETYNYLREWAEAYRRYAIDCPPVSRKFQIIINNKDFGEITAYVTATRYGYKFSLKNKEGQLCKGQSVRTPSGDYDHQLSLIIDDRVEKERHAALIQIARIYLTAFLHANAFLMYGNVVDDKDIIAAGRNEGADKVIIFRKFKEKLYAVPVGHHRSPEGVFEVRGHFRHYKRTGKIVWIDSYMKGTDKEE